MVSPSPPPFNYPSLPPLIPLRPERGINIKVASSFPSHIPEEESRRWCVRPYLHLPSAAHSHFAFSESNLKAEEEDGEGVMCPLFCLCHFCTTEMHQRLEGRICFNCLLISTMQKGEIMCSKTIFLANSLPPVPSF